MARRQNRIFQSALLISLAAGPLVGLAQENSEADAPVDVQTESDQVADPTAAEESATGAPDTAVPSEPSGEVAPEGSPEVAPEASPEGSSNAASVSMEVSAPVSGGDVKAQAEIANGDRVVVSDRGFSIIPPVGWEVRRDFPGTSLLAQVPADKAQGYQRTIQVMVMEGPRYIDEITAEEYEALITRKFSEASTNIEEFRIRQSTPIELADGRPGLLFYSEFTFDGVAMMQAHVLVSSSSRHYLSTYTDLAANFEGSPASPQLTEAWTAMVSLEVDGRTPGRLDSFLMLGIVTLSTALLIGLFVAWRQWKARKLHEALGRGEVELEEQASSAIWSLEPKSLAGEDDESLDDAISRHSTAPESPKKPSKKPVAGGKKAASQPSEAPLSQPSSGEPFVDHVQVRRQVENGH